MSAIMTGLITHLPAAAWPTVIVVLLVVLPRVLDKIRGIIHAITFRRLGDALATKADWTLPETAEQVAELLASMDRSAAAPPAGSGRPPRRDGAARSPADPWSQVAAGQPVDPVESGSRPSALGRWQSGLRRPSTTDFGP
jgi:hypothetical protein